MFKYSPHHHGGQVNIDGISAVNRLVQVLGIHPSKLSIDSKARYGFEITSEVLAEQLISHGLITGQDKTYNIRLPTLNSRNLYLAFILGYFDGDGTQGKTQITSGSRAFLEDIKHYFDIPPDILESSNRDENAWRLFLGAELFNEMLDTYKTSMSRKRKYFMTPEEVIMSRRKYIRPKITDEFLTELQDLLFKSPYKLIADYFGVAKSWIIQIVNEYNLNKPPKRGY